MLSAIRSNFQLIRDKNAKENEYNFYEKVQFRKKFQLFNFSMFPITCFR